MRKIVGVIVGIPTFVGFPIFWVSTTILHLYTGFVAYKLGGPGVWGYVAASASLVFPVVGEIAVFIGAWNVSGSFVNGYSFWVLVYLLLAILLFGLFAFANWIVGTADD